MYFKVLGFRVLDKDYMKPGYGEIRIRDFRIFFKPEPFD